MLMRITNDRPFYRFEASGPLGRGLSKFQSRSYPLTRRNPPMRTRSYLIALTLCLGLQADHAATIVVGTCQRSQRSSTTISNAIAAARPGDVVAVCPGSYAEQLTITKPISLEGIVIPNQPGATIIPPAAGLQQLPANSSFYP